MIQRGGQVVIKMLSDVKQQTIKPLITETIALGAMVMTDEYDIYAKLPEWGYGHKTDAIVQVHRSWCFHFIGLDHVVSLSLANREISCMGIDPVGRLQVWWH